MDGQGRFVRYAWIFGALCWTLGACSSGGGGNGGPVGGGDLPGDTQPEQSNTPTDGQPAADGGATSGNNESSNTSQPGQPTGSTAGGATSDATSNPPTGEGITDPAPATVRLDLTPSRLSLRPGETRSIEIRAYDALNQTVAPPCAGTSQLSFDPQRVAATISGTDAVARVDVEGLAAGVGTLTLQCTGTSLASVAIEVTARPLIPALADLPDGDFGFDASVAVSPAMLALASYESTQQRLVFHSYSSEWHYEYPGSSNPHGRHAQLVLDPLNGQQPVVCAADGDELGCWSRNGAGTWVLHNVGVLGPQPRIAHPVRVAMTASGVLWVLYHDNTAAALKLARSGAASRDDWVVQTLLQGDVGALDVALAPDNNPRAALRLGDVAYYGAPTSGGSWQFEVIDNAPGAGTRIELGVGSDWRPQAVYLRGADLVYADKSNGLWRPVVATHFAQPPAAIAMALDSEARVYVTYAAADTIDLHLLQRAAANTWRDEVMVPGPGAGPDHDVFVDSSARLNLAYHDATTRSAQLYVTPPITDAAVPPSGAAQPASNAGVHQSAMARPTGLSATPGNGTVNLKWGEVTGATGYTVYWSTNSGVTTGSNAVRGVTLPSFEHTGRLNGVPYYYAVSATGALGESALSNEVSSMATLTAPANLHINGDAGRNVVSWDPAPGATAYTLYWNITGSPGPGDPEAVLTGGETSFSHGPLDSATPFYYAVRADDGVSQSPLSAAVVSLPAPSATLAQAPYQDGSIEVSWDTLSGAASYNVYYSDVPGIRKDNAVAVTSTGSPFVHGGLPNQTTWYYAVSAVNADGESALSGESSATAILNNGPLVWRRLSPLSSGRFQLGGAALNGNVYVVGGFDGTADLATVEMYTPGADRWQTLAPLPIARRELSTAALNGQLYAVGGWRGSAVTGAMDAYDPAEDSWTSVPPMPTPRNNFTVAVVNGKLYAMGGWNGAYLNTVQVYDPLLNAWSSLPDMPTARNTLASAVIGTKIYVIGGWGSGRALNTVEVFDTATNLWSTAKAMPTARSRLAVAAMNGRIYAIGGWNGSTVLATVESYDPRTDTWEASVPMPTARNGLAVTLLNNQIYTLGGWSGTRYVNNVETFGAQ